MKAALIKYKGIDAGILTETDTGYEFKYNSDYLSSSSSQPISLTLTLNGKKRRINDADFLAAFRTLGVPENVFERIKIKYYRLLPRFNEEIERSFLNDKLKEAYWECLRRVF